MATITRRGRNWQAKVRRRGYPVITATFDTRRQAEAWARQTEADLDRGVFELRADKCLEAPLGELLQRYAREITPRKRGSRSEAYRLRILSRDPIARCPLRALTARVVAAYRDRRLAQVSGSTVRRELAALSAVLNHTIREWEIPLPQNPVAAIRKPPENPARERRLRPGEETRLRAAMRAEVRRDAAGRFAPGCRNGWLEPIFDLALETAMRRSEILALRWENVDLQRRTARIPLAKNGTGRTIPLSSRAIAVLKTLPRLDERVFPVTDNAVKLAWQRAVKRAGIRDLHFHDLRHEATSRLFEKGLQPMEVAAITGYRDLRMLMRYTHLHAENLLQKLG